MSTETILNDLLANSGGATDTISKAIADIIQNDSQFAKEIKSKILDVVNIASNRLKGDVGKLKLENTTVSLDTLYSQTPRDSLSNKLKHQKLLSKITTKLSTAVDKTEFTFGDKPIKLTDIFSSPKASKVIKLKYQATLYKITGKLSTAASKAKFNFKGGVSGNKSQYIKLSDIFSTPKASKLINLKYQWTLGHLTGKLSKAAKDAEFNFKGGDDGDKSQYIKLSDVFSTPEAMLPIKIKYQWALWHLTSKLSKAAKDAEFTFSDEPIKIQDLFGVTPEASILTRMSYQRMLRKISKKLGKSFDTDKSGGKSGGDIESGLGSRGIFEKEAQEVNVVGFSSEAIKSLQNILGNRKPQTKVTGEDDSEEGMSLFDKIKSFGMKGLFALIGGASIAAIAWGLTGLWDSGPMKGLKKLSLRGGIQSGKMLAKHLMKRTKLFFKMFGDNLLAKFDWLLKPGKAIISKFSGGPKLISKLTKGTKTFFKTFGDDIVKNFDVILKPLSGAGAKLLKGGKGIFTKIASKIGAKLGLKAGMKTVGKSAAKKIPVLGLILGLGFAVSRFKSGDIVGGLLELASGIASTVPLVGTAISVGIDLFSAWRDYKGGGSEQLGKSNANSVVKNAWGKVIETIEKMPLINLLTNLPAAFAYMAEGQWGNAGKEIVKIFPGGAMVLELLGSSGKTFSAYKDTRAKGGSFKDGMLAFFKKFTRSISIGIVESLPMWMQGTAAKLLGIKGYKDDISAEAAANKVKNNAKSPTKVNDWTGKANAIISKSGETLIPHKDDTIFARKDFSGKEDFLRKAQALAEVEFLSDGTLAAKTLGKSVELTQKSMDNIVERLKIVGLSTQQIKEFNAEIRNNPAGELPRAMLEMNKLARKFKVKPPFIEGMSEKKMMRLLDKGDDEGEAGPWSGIIPLAGEEPAGYQESWSENTSAGLNDFIWRPGSKPTPISPDDTVIGAKDGVSFKEGKDIDLHIQELKTVMENVEGALMEILGVNKATLSAAGASSQSSGPLPPMPGVVEVGREAASDRAYNLRTNAWKILRGVV